jgi:colanic acid/amylovoran biosynthesis glycosyltransferase
MKLAFAYPGNQYSETFIRDQLRLLQPAFCLYDGYYPMRANTEPEFLGFPLKIPLFRAAMRRLSPTLFHQWYTKRLAALLQQQESTAMLVHYGPTGVNIMDAALRASVPYVVHFHGFDAYDYATIAQYEQQYRRMFAAAAAIIAVSNDMKGQLELLGAPAEKINLIPCGIDLKQFSGARPADNPPMFLGVGRFVPKKNPLLVIRSFAEVAKKFKNSTLIMVGDGPLLPAAQRLTAEMNLSDQIIFKGVQSHDAIAALMRQARAYVQHSTRAPDGDSEGTPVAVLEAAASGLPVLGTFHAGIKDAVLHERSGLLVAEGDWQGMAAYMIRLAEEPVLAATLGAAGPQHMAQHYASGQQIARLRDLLESIS